MAFDLESPYSHQYSFGVQREVLPGFVGTINYVGSLGRKLTPSVGMTVNLDVPGPGAGAIQQRRPLYNMFPNVSGINLMANWVTSSYQALQSTLERRYKNGLGFVANYTWAHGIRRFGLLLLRHRTEGAPRQRLQRPPPSLHADVQRRPAIR